MALKHFAEGVRHPGGGGIPISGPIRQSFGLFAGEAGVGMPAHVKRLMRDADVILAVNVRFGEMTTDAYTLLSVPIPTQKLIHVHASDREIGKIYVPTIGIQAGPNAFATALTPVSGAWSNWRRTARADYEASFDCPPQPSPVDMAAVISWLRDRLPDDVILTNGAGNFTVWPNKFFKFGPQARLLAPQSGAMGYGLPAAIAAKVACPARTVVCFAGDGDFQMNLPELGTAMQAGAQPIVLILNNGIYGTIRAHQERNYPARVSGTVLENPDFVALARAYGYHAERVQGTDDFAASFERSARIDDWRRARFEYFAGGANAAPNAQSDATNGARSQGIRMTATKQIRRGTDIVLRAARGRFCGRFHDGDRTMTYMASRLSTVRPSASMAVSQAAKALRASGRNVIDLGLGEPDFPTPRHIIDAAHAAALEGQTLYTAAAGTPRLVAAIIGKFERENGLNYAPDEIIVANGAKQIIFNALMATVNEGDEVILPAPYFVSYPEMTKLFGGTPVAVVCDADVGFRLTPEKLEAAITPRTKWLFLNLPGNPSGAAYSKTELAALGAVLERHPQVLVLSDEIYEHILFDGRNFTSFGAACPGLRSRSLIVNGVSKAYAMTGWRVGYAAGPAALIRAMTTVQSQSCTSVCSLAQAAAAAALEGPQMEVTRFRDAFQRRRDLVVAGIKEIAALTLDPPEGAFYAFIGCARLIGAKTPEGLCLSDDVAVSRYLLEAEGVATVPGTAYGLSPFFRISTATSDTVLSDAVLRISTAIDRLSFMEMR